MARQQTPFPQLTVTDEGSESLSRSLQSFAGSLTRAADFYGAPLTHAEVESVFSGSRRTSRRTSLASQITRIRTNSITESQQHSIRNRTWSSSVYSGGRFEGFGQRKPSLVPTEITEIGETTSLLSRIASVNVPEEYRAHRSDLIQTIFNSINIILGMGVLNYALAFRRAGLLFGGIIFLWSAVVTLWTARMIEICISRHEDVRSFGDLALAAYGPRARIAVMVLVALELTAASVAQIVLFSESLSTFFMGTNEVMWKLVCGATFVPLSYSPLRYLGISSAFCVLFFFVIGGILVTTGIVRRENPGSLHHLPHVSVLPDSFSMVLSSIGLLLSAWGGHTVFAELYYDMQKPEKFFTAVKTSYAITFPLYLLMGLVGYLMFGNQLRGPITTSLISLEDHPGVISITILVLTVFMPVAKIPLNIYPLASALERIFEGEKSTTGKLGRSLVRASVGVTFMILAIVFPNMDKIMSFMGVIAGLMIAIILPVCCYIAIMGDEVSSVERWVGLSCVAVSVVLGVGGLVSIAMPVPKI